MSNCIHGIWDIKSCPRCKAELEFNKKLKNKRTPAMKKVKCNHNRQVAEDSYPWRVRCLKCGKRLDKKPRPKEKV